MQNQYKNMKKNEDGAILAIVMMALTVLSLLGLALATASYANIKLTTVDRDYQATYYIAEGGANQTYADIKRLVESSYENTHTEAAFFAEFNTQIDQRVNGVSISNFEESFTEKPRAEVKVEQITDGNPRSYQITSEGIIGKRTRTVIKPFQINWESGSAMDVPENAVAIIKNSISLKGSASLSGDVYIDSPKSETIVMKGGASINNGDVYVPENAVGKAIKTPNNFGGTIPEDKVNSTSILWDVYQEIIADFPTFPTYSIANDETIGGEYNRFNVIDDGNLNINSWQVSSYDYTLNLAKNLQFNRMTFGSNYTLDIITNNKDYNIVVKNLDLSNGHINIIGSGKVNIYVEDTFSIGSGSTINSSGNTNQVNIYYKGSKPVQISGGQSINGSIFVEKADIKLTGGGSFEGFLVSGGTSITYAGGTYSSAFVLAPYADVVLKGGAGVDGTIIANKLEGVGGVSATFNTIDLANFPFGTNSSPSAGDLIERQPTVELD
ncbi:hypothetical protein GCM10011351_11340 [Paraliobacillus quinghaiensis]|uniref:Type 4 fimbrial biogenesis protein PilX N-terminal domain-containing protein n=1 Tax=Paraliobacillus quinghaiensis TaxID=470815 RepID=A0A917TL59_9BACI|nr:pilus assembly PilX N-terminal domain-containing protein [Paraliobacillus quinghaiensis]GGM27252.1 hypothetical protein GCM10011351_11340 [Paraliobacillus quinghaiensis]